MFRVHAHPLPLAPVVTQESEQVWWVVLGQCVFLGKRAELLRCKESCFGGLRPVFIVSTQQWCSVSALSTILVPSLPCHFIFVGLVLWLFVLPHHWGVEMQLGRENLGMLDCIYPVPTGEHWA